MSEPTEIDRHTQIMMEHAEAVGSLCMFWAQLDLTLIVLIERLSELDEVTTACFTSTARDTSQRCEIARRLAFLKAPNDVWRDCLIGILSRIQNDLASKRNRYIHDDWEIKNDELIQFERRVKIQKPQAKEALKLFHLTPRTARPGEINDLTSLVIELLVHVIFLGQDFVTWRKTGKQPVPNEKALLLSKSNPQENSQLEAGASQPQPQS